MKKIIFTGLFATLSFLSLGFLTPSHSYAYDVLAPVCSKGAGASAVCQGSDATSGQDPVLTIIDDAIRIISLIIGVASVIVIIVQGLRIVLSNGDSKTFESARNGIIYACIGVVIAILAQVLVVFVLQRFGPSS